MAKLILVRHGETEKNVSGKLHRDQDPVVLNLKGKDQILTTANYLKTQAPDIVFSSKEARAIASGEIISQILGVPLEKIDGLQERNWGEFSGKTWPEIKAVLDPMTLEERYNYTPPQGESWKQLEERIIRSIKLLINSHPKQTLVIVTHIGSIRALMPFLLTLPKEESFKYDLDNASLTIFAIKSDHEFFQELINSTTHLPDNLKSIK